jgi:4-diphosphocytidyl-2-C-methyl-D-erythritol kinase
MPTAAVECPAKVNLFLAVTGKRPDGFHDLVSIVAQLQLADRLELTLEAGEGPDTLEIDDPSLPSGPENLVLKAIAAYRQARPFARRVRARLEKRIPHGAGLGGGSSDAAGALRALDVLLGAPMGAGLLRQIAAAVGSDCPLFLASGPCLMRGRGELIERVPEPWPSTLAGQRLLLCKPPFGIPTAWAYGELARCSAYLPAAAAEAALASGLSGSASLDDLFFNSFEGPVFRKYLPLAELRAVLLSRFGLKLHLSGSGSCCFVYLRGDEPLPAIRGAIADAWGPEAFVAETAIRG